MLHVASGGTDSLILVTGTTPQIRLNSNAADSNDNDRAIFGLATANGQFYSTTSAGDAVLRTTDASSLIFGEGTTERLRIDASGRLLKSGQATLSSTSLNHPIQVAAASDAAAIAIIGRAADDIAELNFYEADKSTNLGEIQYRRDHVNIRHRVGEIRFATAGVTDRLIINSGGDVNITGITTANQLFEGTTRVATTGKAIAMAMLFG